jgi:hypothetical protein
LCEAKQEHSDGELNEAVREDDEDGVEVQPRKQRKHPLRVILKDLDMLSQAETRERSDTYKACRAEELYKGKN